MFRKLPTRQLRTSTSSSFSSSPFFSSSNHLLGKPQVCRPGQVDLLEGEDENHLFVHTVIESLH